MDAMLEDAISELRSATAEGNAEKICLAARFLRMCCLQARGNGIDVWERRAPEVRAALEEAVDVIAAALVNETDDGRRELEQHSYERVLDRLRALFPEYVAQYPPAGAAGPSTAVR